MTELEIRPGTAEDWPAIFDLLHTAFHDPPDDETRQLKETVFEPDRSLVIFDRDRGDPLVAHAGAFTRELTVPGGVLPAGHVTLVAVAPSHQRRGLLTRLMHRQLAELPEPLAALWASEGRIYPRFGYGQASARVSLTVESREIRLPEPATPGRLRTVPAAQARPDLERLYEAARLDRPGWSSRDERWWSSVLADPAGTRKGATARRLTLHEGADGVDGYVTWRGRSGWSGTGPTGEVLVQELVAANPDAYLALWRFLLSIGLTRSVAVRFAATDEPLLLLANEPRRLGPALHDGLYVRIVDLPAALTGRRYATGLDLVLEVTDRLLPGNAGRWRLTTTGGGDKPACTRVAEPADLACDIADLAAAYLGSTSLAALAAAGRVRQLRPDALAAASTGFGWHRAPSAVDLF